MPEISIVIKKFHGLPPRYSWAARRPWENRSRGGCAFTETGARRKAERAARQLAEETIADYTVAFDENGVPK